MYSLNKEMFTLINDLEWRLIKKVLGKYAVGNRSNQLVDKLQSKKVKMKGRKKRDEWRGRKWRKSRGRNRVNFLSSTEQNKDNEVRKT